MGGLLLNSSSSQLYKVRRAVDPPVLVPQYAPSSLIVDQSVAPTSIIVTPGVGDAAYTGFAPTIATRLYFAADFTHGIAGSINPANDTMWDFDGSGVSRRVLTYKSESSKTTTNFGAGQTTTGETLAMQFISDPITVAQTIDGTVSIAIQGYEGSANEHASLAFSVRVLSGDGLTVRGTLIAKSLVVDEFPINPTIETRSFTNLALTSVAASATDVLVVEVGIYRVLPADLVFNQLNVGARSTVADLALTEGVTTDGTPWIEFSNNIGFTPVGYIAQLQKGAATYTGFSPNLPVTRFPGLGAATYDGFAPNLPVTVSTGVGAATYDGFAPTVVIPVILPIGLGVATYTGFAPAIPVTVNLGVGAATYDGFTPALPVTRFPGVGDATYTGFAETLLNPNSALLGTGAATYDGFAPTVVVSFRVGPAIAKWVGVGITTLQGAVSVTVTGAAGVWTGNTPTFAPGVVTFATNTAGTGWHANTVVFAASQSVTVTQATGTWTANGATLVAGTFTLVITGASATWTGTSPTLVPGAVTFTATQASGNHWHANSVTFAAVTNYLLTGAIGKWIGQSPAFAQTNTPFVVSVSGVAKWRGNSITTTQGTATFACNTGKGFWAGQRISYLGGTPVAGIAIDYPPQLLPHPQIPGTG